MYGRKNKKKCEEKQKPPFDQKVKENTIEETLNLNELLPSLKLGSSSATGI